MNVVKLDSRFRAADWRRAFAARLIQLRPDMNPDVADEVSDREALTSSSVSPVLAAERYATGMGRPIERVAAANTDAPGLHVAPGASRGT